MYVNPFRIGCGPQEVLHRSCLPFIILLIIRCTFIFISHSLKWVYFPVIVQQTHRNWLFLSLLADISFQDSYSSFAQQMFILGPSQVLHLGHPRLGSGYADRKAFSFFEAIICSLGNVAGSMRNCVLTLEFIVGSLDSTIQAKDINRPLSVSQYRTLLFFIACGCQVRGLALRLHKQFQSLIP